MTRQQQADEWLRIWQQLRQLGLSPSERDMVIELAIHSFVNERKGT